MSAETVPLLDEYTRAMTAEDADDLHGAVRIVRAREALADRLRELEAAAAERDELRDRLTHAQAVIDGTQQADETLHAELAAIKAGGGEPVAFLKRLPDTYWSLYVKTPKQMRALDALSDDTPLYRHPHVTLTEEQVRADFAKYVTERGMEFAEPAELWLACAKHYGRVGGGT